MVIGTIVAIRVIMVITGIIAIMAITTVIAMTTINNITFNIAIIIIGIIIIISNKAIHIYAANITANIAITDITVITTIMAIIQPQYSVQTFQALLATFKCHSFLRSRYEGHLVTGLKQPCVSEKSK